MTLEITIIKRIIVGLGLMLITGAAGFAQPSGWDYRSYDYEKGRPSAKLVKAATAETVVLHPGDELAGYRVLTVNADRIVFRKGEEMASLLRTRESAIHKVLDRRVDQLQAERKAVREVLEQLCRKSGLGLTVKGEIEGTISVDFSNMTVREILDSLCRYSRLNYRIEDSTLMIQVDQDDERTERL